MKQIAPSNGSYLLEAPLEILHRESMEWIKEIEFWKDEISFFYKILATAIKKDPSKFKTQKAKEIENHLIQIASETIEDLRLDAIIHEKFLDARKGDVKSDEPTYRSYHRRLSFRFGDFESEFRAMKRAIIHLIEHPAAFSQN